MIFNIKKFDIEKEHIDCIVTGIFSLKNLSNSATMIDNLSNGYIKKILSYGEMQGKIKQSLILYNIPNIISKKFLLIGCGKKNKINDDQYQEIICTIVKNLNKMSMKKVVVYLNELNVEKRDLYWKIRQFIEIFYEKTYIFSLNKNKQKTFNNTYEIIIHLEQESDFSIGKIAIKHALAIASSINIAKNISNLPSNICNAEYISHKAKEMENIYNNIHTYNIYEKDMKLLGMNAYLAVGSGSENQSIMSIIQYNNSKKSIKNPIILIGKGLTFDSGGLSIKPAESMSHMKYDMCGAAAVYGIINMIATLELPLYVIGVLACCENMIGKGSMRPGDIITTMSGKTVEVLNTDAEGRLVLCDVLTYVQKFNPEIVIDIATLTGACSVALGTEISGLFSNSTYLINELYKASKYTLDYVWHLPIFKKYKKQLNSKFADINNIGGRMGGAITAACFLESFVKKYQWAHLDVAGTATNEEKKVEATGRPIPLISQFLLNRVKSLLK
ncbi:leucyl aminopeptidase [Candidatus Tachikawaea gelatinosa]|uniref:Probable cytosol aminopeptidase n=1 Tax=Candidatus Tachikawaea gelatinosa TaxID=1410383 RepID=A0A090AJU5_9ENTR|nr:leucyl aminopeptidase [Candidatus Tachikawaea gelatinosa]BAP58733.1 probable cytosol aminopeptidase [Candidatus Tachikawaea gelatinosa]